MKQILIGLVYLGVAAAGCSSSLKVKTTKSAAADLGASADAPVITGRSPVVVGPGDRVTLTGRNFRPTMKLALNGEALDVTVASDTSASFAVPNSASFGTVALTATQDGATQEISLVFTAGKTDYPIITAPAAEVCSDKQFYDARGVLQTGTRDCASGAGAEPPVACTSDGQVGCVTDTAFKAVDMASVAAGSILTGRTIAGVAGTLGPCAADGAGNCVVDGTAYKAAKMSGFSSYDVRMGVHVAGVGGVLSGAPAACGTDGESGCLTGGTFLAADTTGLASKVLSGQSVAGVGGNVLLPLIGKVLNGTLYGVGGNGMSGSLTLPPVGQVLTTSGAYGVAGTSISAGTATLPPVGQVLTSSGTYGAGGTGVTAGTATVPAAANVYNAVYGVGGNSLTGTLADCNTDGGTGCVVGGSYVAAKVGASNLDAANIKNSVTIGGITGQYPSATYSLPGAGGATGLTSLAASTAAGTYEFWDAAGTRHSGSITDAGTVTPGTADQTFNTSLYRQFTVSGDADLTAANIVDPTVIFGVTGTAVVPPPCASDGDQNCTVSGIFKAANVTGITGKDVRSGRNLAGFAGALKANCRNAVVTAKFNYDGAVTSLGNIGVTSGTAFDYWDTADDYYGVGVAPTNPASWTQDNLCNSTNWIDVTPSGGCVANPTGCQYQDNTSGLIVTKNQAAATWSAAVQNCAASTYGGQTAGTWRLPTQKEMMQLYIDGLLSLSSTSFMTLGTMQDNFWTSTTMANSTAKAWYIYLALGNVDPDNKTVPYYSICVR